MAKTMHAKWVTSVTLFSAFIVTKHNIKCTILAIFKCTVQWY